MTPRPRRTITVLEARPHSSSIPEQHIEYDRDMTGPSPAPPSWTQTAKQTRTNDASPSDTRNHRSTRQDIPSTITTDKSWTTSKATSDLTVTSYSSTTTIYTTSSNEGFATSAPLESSSTIAGPPIHRTHIGSPYNIPDPPAWFPYVIGVLLAAMMALAVLFYCVNFPPTGGSGIRRRYHAWRTQVAESREGRTRYGYQKIDDDGEDDGDHGRTSTETSPGLRKLNEAARTAEAVTTSVNTPGLHNTPTLYSRRRKLGDKSLDKDAVAGLGISVDGGQKSFDETVLRPDMDRPLPPPPRSAVQAYFSPAAMHSTALTRPRKDSTDLEAGLLKPPAHYRRRSPPPSRAQAPPSSPGIRVLEMVGGSVEYAAEKMSRFMYDSVKGDPEEGLLLPVRDCERERKEC